MARISKNRKAVLAKYDPDKVYTLAEASKVLKDLTFTKFDPSVDVDIRLGIDPKKSDQMVRGVVSLPHGLGKTVRVLVLCSPDKAQEAKDAGAEHVGLD
ncbi:MAG: 50S ribosomal protein L1, partial [Cytophagales bacterium]|nr:50S ribosomal protein L1 [Cytophagales bacterium]